MRLNFSRANLFASGEKRGVDQAKKIFNELNSKRLGISLIQVQLMIKIKTQKISLEKSLNPFKVLIQMDKLYLIAYQNLIYVYKQCSY